MIIPNILSVNTLIQMPRMGHAIFQAHFNEAKTVPYMCGNYIMQAEKHVALPN